MKKIILVLISAFATWSCGQTGKKVSRVADSTVTKLNVIHPGTKNSWIDTLLIAYLANSSNPLVKLARKDTISEEWLFDRIEKTDTADYLVFQIGHDVVDEGNTNKRFQTDSWVYIDSLRKKIYEYNLYNDSLFEFKK